MEMNRFERFPVNSCLRFSKGTKNCKRTLTRGWRQGDFLDQFPNISKTPVGRFLERATVIRMRMVV